MFADLTPLRVLWLTLALIGAGVSLSGGLTRLVGADWVAATALGVWCVAETMVRRNWAALIAVPALMLGVGCALPLYLFMRSARVV